MRRIALGQPPPGIDPWIIQAFAEIQRASHEDSAEDAASSVTSEIAAAIATRQPIDATLTALAALDGTAGLLTQTAADTFARRTLVEPTTGFSITNPAGTAGNPTFTWDTVGTFTPGISFGGASVGVTYGTQAGFYLHFGQLVLFWIQLILTSKGSSTGNALITGLPVTASGAVNCACSIVVNGGTALTLTAGMSAHVGAGTTAISLRAPGTTGDAVVTDANIDGDFSTYIAGAYLS